MKDHLRQKLEINNSRETQIYIYSSYTHLFEGSIYIERNPSDQTSSKSVNHPFSDKTLKRGESLKKVIQD